MVKSIKVTLDDIVNSVAVDAASKEFVVPKKATILSNSSGTLIQTEQNSYYLVTVGDWFRSTYYGKNLPQVDDFNQLQDYGFTLIKDKIIRNTSEVKKEIPKVEKVDGQEIRSKNIISTQKTNKTVAPNIKRKEEDKNRS